jgi:nitric oxide reductase activation protein
MFLASLDNVAFNTKFDVFHLKSYSAIFDVTCTLLIDIVALMKKYMRVLLL